MPTRAFFGFKMGNSKVEVRELFEAIRTDDLLKWEESVNDALTLYQMWRIINVGEIIEEIAKEAGLSVAASPEVIFFPVEKSGTIDNFTVNITRNAWYLFRTKERKTVGARIQRGCLDLSAVREVLLNCQEVYGGSIGKGVYVTKEIYSPSIEIVSKKPPLVVGVHENSLIFSIKLNSEKITLNDQRLSSSRVALEGGYNFLKTVVGTRVIPEIYKYKWVLGKQKPPT